jgi:hypothetical protein
LINIIIIYQVPIPITNGLDILTLLIDDADIAEWNNEGLPGDRMSIENATILTSCDRWPLMIDPQLQGLLVFILKRINFKFPFEEAFLLFNEKLLFQYLNRH